MNIDEINNAINALIKTLGESIRKQTEELKKIEDELKSENTHHT